MGSMSEVFGRKKSKFLLSVDPVSSMNEDESEDERPGHTSSHVLSLLHFLLPTLLKNLRSPPPKPTILEFPRFHLQLVPMSSSASKHPLSIRDPLYPSYSGGCGGSTEKEGWVKGGKRRARARDQLLAGEYEEF